jgi:hypothetical protein
MTDVKKMMDILERDYAKNHQGREYDLNTVKQAFLKYLQGGHKYLVEGDTIFVAKEQSPGVAEFHAFHGGDAAELIRNTNQMLYDLPPQFQFAVTYYDDPRLNQYASYSKYPATVQQINGGVDRTYEMRFDLRSK